MEELEEPKKEQKKILVATYGSLRKDEYNYDRFKHLFGDEFKYIKTSSILGYNLYDLGSYPGLKPANNHTDRVIIDVMECSPRCFDRIEAMEHGAGYITVNVLDEVTREKYKVYVYEYPCTNLVKSGDWSKYLAKSDVAVI